MSMINILPLKEQLPLKLRSIYEQFGYKKYRMDKFEPYDMYMENKSFLKYDGIITFTNPNGRLMALKPDVTMSIVKNTGDREESSKLYYNENVFRLQAGASEYSEINQIGLEFIGGDSRYSQAEVVLLALRSLEAVSDEYILNIAHMGFAEALLDYSGIKNGNKEECLSLIKQKNMHGLYDFAERYGIPAERINAVTGIIGLSGGFEKVLADLAGLAYNADMTKAVEELRELYEAVSRTGLGSRLRLDFSVTDDPDYYNGIVFQGYIPNTPRAVLCGGRYDNLMRRFGKVQNAVGFALYLGELTGALNNTEEFDADLLLVYGDASSVRVVEAVELLKKEYNSIRAEKTLPAGIKARKTIYISEVIENA